MELLFIILCKSLIRNNTINHNQLPLAEEIEREREQREKSIKMAASWENGALFVKVSKCAFGDEVLLGSLFL